MKRCPHCGCKIRRVRGTDRHYGSLDVCKRLERYRWIAQDLIELYPYGSLVARAKAALAEDRRAR
jgi:hypothetical protein